MRRATVGLLTLLLTTSGPSVGARQAGAPFIFDDNRSFAEIAFVRPDGTLRIAHAFVDLGTPALVLNETLRRELDFDGRHDVRLRIGDVEISVAASAIETTSRLSWTGTDGRATVAVEAVLSGSIMTNYQVTFDYAARRLILTRPTHAIPAGVPVPCVLNPITGLISVPATVGDGTYRIAVDSGSSYSWVRADVAEAWARAHPSWNRGVGAIGEANMQTRPDGAEARALVLRVPDARLGALRLAPIGIVGVRSSAPPFPPAAGQAVVTGDLFDWYSRKAPEPVIGWIGANVLKAFRLTIDFPHQMTYWERERPLDQHDLDQVGITLETRDTERGYFVAGIAIRDGQPTTDGLAVGDKLIQIDGMLVDGATRGAIFAALHGPAGAVRVVIVERHGQRVTARVHTTAF